MPQLSITSNGTSSAIELTLEQDYKLALRGTIDPAAVFVIEQAEIAGSAWSVVKPVPDADPVSLRGDNRLMIASGGIQLRVVTTGFGTSTDVIVDASPWGQAQRQAAAAAAIDERNVLVEGKEYRFENQVSNGVDNVIITEQV